MLCLILTSGGTHNFQSTMTTEIYNTDTNMVTPGIDLPQAEFNHCGALRKQTAQIYFVGGMSGGLTSMKGWTFIYDMSLGQLSTITNQMSTPRVEHACAVLEDENIIIVAGGYTNSWIATDTVEILNLITETWSQARAMPFAGIEVWAVGEVVFNWKNQIMYQYQLSGNQWVEIENAPLNLANLRPIYIPVNAGLGSFCPYL